MQGSVLGQRGGLNINGIVEEYKVLVGENVSAGDFVKFFDDYIKTEVDTQLSSDHNSGNLLSSIMLNNNKVLIVYRTSSGLYAMICTINDKEIIVGVNTLLKIISASATRFSAVALNDKKVFVVNSVNNSNNPTSSIYICVINEDEISLELSKNIDALRDVSVALLNEYEVFISYCLGENNYLYACICTEDGGVSRVDSSKDKILGVAKTRGKERKIVKVYTPTIKGGI